MQIGSHEGNTDNDPIFNEVDEQSQLILVEPVPELFEKLKSNYTRKFQHVQDYRQENLVFINKAVSTFIGKIENKPRQRVKNSKTDKFFKTGLEVSMLSQNENSNST